MCDLLSNLNSYYVNRQPSKCQASGTAQNLRVYVSVCVLASVNCYRYRAQQINQ